MDKDDAKSRGSKHRSNKKKYNKNKPAAHVPQVKPKISLESNWDRYEQKDASGSTISSSTDFAVLANAPITLGSHFQFKSDKDLWAEEETVRGESFNLDLVLLEKSLATLPFSLRSGIEEEYFSENRQRLMTALTDNVKAYREFVKSHQNKDLDVIFEPEGEDPTDDSADVSTTINLSSQEPISRVEGDGDLEQWLDDILDD